jgi:hypothetical protein
MKRRKPPIAANIDKKLSTMRRASNAAQSRYSIGGAEKTGHFAPRPITLPKMPWDEKGK